MQQLQLLPDPTYHIDATPTPSMILLRVRRLLTSRVFQVNSAAFDGMDHLVGTPPALEAEAATKLARELRLSNFSLDSEGRQRLARLAKIMEVNPQLVNAALPTEVRALYYQAVHDHVGAFALGLEDLKEPARVPPFEIRTFVPPAHRPPIRAPPEHAAFIASEVR